MRTADNEFNAHTYLKAAREHIGTVQVLLDAERYVATFYLSGVAVECMLRAYYFRRNPVFDARHDLLEIARSAKFTQNMPDTLREQVTADLNDVALRWSNAHRYRSEAALRGFLNRAKLNRFGEGRTIRGSVVSYNASILVEAAVRVVDVGTKQWEKFNDNGHKPA